MFEDLMNETTKFVNTSGCVLKGNINPHGHIMRAEFHGILFEVEANNQAECIKKVSLVLKDLFTNAGEVATIVSKHPVTITVN